MGFALPSGVVNTNSAYFFAIGGSSEFGPLVKQLSDQTLVLINYTQVTPPPLVTAVSFTVDVSSNPELMVAYPYVDQSGALASFLISGGIEGQQYNITITAQVPTGLRSDVLRVNIPSSGDCECERINPVPAQYNQLPLGTQGYVNTGARYFWGSAPPANPNVMDQWFNPTTNTLYEWVTDGSSFYWETMASAGLVTEAPTDSRLYTRYNGHWVADPIQSDVTTAQYWCRLPGMWQPHPLQNDAPNDGHTYGRKNNGWVIAPASVISSDAPSDGNLYGRMNGGWTMTPKPVIAADAPNDGNAYMRIAGAWRSGGTLTSDLATRGNLGAGGSLAIGGNAFIQGVTTFGAQVALPYDPISPLQAATKQYVDNNYLPLAAAAANYVQKSGSTMTGALLLASDPTTALQASTKGYVDTLVANTQVGAPFLSTLGGTVTGDLTIEGTTTLGGDPVNPFEAATKKYVDDNTVGGIGDAPYDGNVYGRNSGAWTQALAIVGGTLTGTLVLNADPTTNLQASTKQYVDNSISTAVAAAPYVRTSGGVMTGLLTLSGPPTANNGAATKQYVDALPGSAAPLMNGNAAAGSSANVSHQDHVHPSDTSRIPFTGGTMTGLLVLSGAPTVANGAATKAYADTMVPLAGGTMTGALLLASNPTANLGAATKQYVDTSSAAALAAANANTNSVVTNYLPLAGGTLTGSIIVPAVVATAGLASTTGGAPPLLMTDPPATDNSAFIPSTRWVTAFVNTPTNMTIDCGTF